MDSIVLKGLDGNNEAKFTLVVRQELSKLVHRNGDKGISRTDVLDIDMMRLALDANHI
jgi:hypothetical protein